MNNCWLQCFFFFPLLFNEIYSQSWAKIFHNDAEKFQSWALPISSCTNVLSGSHQYPSLQKQSVLPSPRNPEQKIIKRVIALEGDIIKTIGYKKKYVKVPHGHIWVEGDHHGHSFDSNAFGPVSLGLLHARATHILWPPQRWQKLQPMLPPERKPLQREQE
uniref:Mitochondrial inner membrane protease subunit 2 n=1 Tax=Dromaius novaehollandiae TaxID=8790 RepID=A0A8C4IZR2_DRONO